jgi:hypothetical protein
MRHPGSVAPIVAEALCAITAMDGGARAGGALGGARDVTG